MTVVYVDVLLVVNFIIDYLLLLGCGHLCGRSIRRPRLISGAILGAVSTLVIFLPPLPFWGMLLYQLGTAVALVAVSFSWIGPRQLLKDVFVFFTVSFLLAGTMTAIWVNFAPRGMACFNGVVYFDISIFTLLFTAVAAYLLLLIFSRIFKGRRPRQEPVQVEVTLGGCTVTIPAIVDTGNRLREPFSGIPVAVCGVEELYSSLPLQLVEGILTGDFAPCQSLPPRWQPRMVPFRAVGGSGVLAAIRPDRMIVHEAGERYRIEEVYLALSPKKIGDGSYRMLLSGEVIKLKIYIQAV